MSRAMGRTGCGEQRGGNCRGHLFHACPPLRNRERDESFVSPRQQDSKGEFPMADDRDDVERERTTVVETGGGGGGGVLAVVLLIIVVLVLLYMFRGQLGLGASKSVIPSTVNVNVNHS
jgi:hypothetical protein